MELGPIDGVTVLGAGTAFPARTLDNEAVLRRGAPRDAERLAFAARGLERTVGVRTRAWAHLVGTPLDHASEETTLDLGVAAARAALADAALDPRDVSLVLVATSTPHRMTSTVAAPLGAALGADALCMDARAGCAAGLAALGTAALHVAAGAGPVLLVGTETFSKVVPPQHPMGVVSLGDGAGALVLGRGAGALRALYARTDGRLAGLIGTTGALPPTPDEIARGGYVLSGSPDELAAALPARYVEALRATLYRAGLDAAAVDAFVPHQTSLPLIDEVAAQLGFRRVWREGVARHANIGAAGWLVAFAEARAAGLCPAGATVALAAVGGGMTWAAALLTC